MRDLYIILPFLFYNDIVMFFNKNKLFNKIKKIFEGKLWYHL